MNTLRSTFLAFVVATVATVSMAAMNLATAATADDLTRDSRQALQTLYKTEPVAQTLAKNAKGILVFPNIVKAGLVFGGSYGEVCC